MPSYPGAIVPATPFQHPVPLPTLGTGLLTVTFDQGWLPYLVGAAKALCAASTWDPPDPTTIQDTILAAYDLLQTLSGAVPGTCADQIPVYGSWELNDMPLVRQDPDNPCLFQMQCPDGTWDTVFDMSKCVTNPAPGAGTTPPGPSTCQSYTLYPKASAITPLPFLVNTGDVITVTSEMGAGSDGTLDWFCPDGSFFIAGACAGGGSPLGTDPLPTTNHMALILRIGSAYYPLPVGGFTVPSGVVNSPAYIQVNDSSLTDDSGEYVVQLQFCNNQGVVPVAFCHDSKFVTTPDGYSTYPYADSGACVSSAVIHGSWVSGTGFEGDQIEQTDCSHPRSTLAIQQVFSTPISLLTIATLKGNLPAGYTGNFVEVSVSTTPDFSSGVTGIISATLTASGAFSQAWTGSLSNIRAVRITFLGNFGSGTPQVAIDELELSGTGANPFGPSNC